MNNFNQMVSAVNQGGGGNDVRITYVNVVDSQLLNASDFQATPSAVNGAGITPISANVIDVTFAADVSSDTNIVYSGNAVGFITPQTIAQT